MKVVLQKVTKRFGAQTVLRNASLVLEKGSITGVTGPNGSGKSTLLQLIAGAIIPDAGNVEHFKDDKLLDPSTVFRNISIASPYLNMYDDLHLEEALSTHARFKPLIKEIDRNKFFELVKLEHAKSKPIRDLSSGMLQRFKLGLAILSDTSLLLLDEPGSNLDKSGLDWYHQLLTANKNQRTVVICSNREEEELRSCEEVIAMGSLSQAPAKQK